MTARRSLWRPGIGAYTVDPTPKRGAHTSIIRSVTEINAFVNSPGKGAE